jgi:nucleoside-diphosphate-sugar epimerase
LKEEIAIEELADIIIKLTGSKSKKRYVPYKVAYGRPIEDMMRGVPNLQRIKKTIGWEPKTSLKEALSMIVQEQTLGKTYG